MFKHVLKAYKQVLVQFATFNVIGIMNTAIDFVIFMMLTEKLGLMVIPSNIISYGCGIMNSFLLNSKFTFRAYNKHNKMQFIKFVTVNLVSLSISTLCLFMFVNVMGIQNVIAKIISLFFSVIINFSGNKIWVFEAQNKKLNPVKEGGQKVF